MSGAEHAAVEKDQQRKAQAQDVHLQIAEQMAATHFPETRGEESRTS